jgi:uncharacterized protein YkwD
VRRSLRTTVALACALFAGCSGTPQAPSPLETPRDNISSVAEPSQTAISLFELTNAARERAGTPALRSSGALMQAAQLQADQMAAARQMAHTLPAAPYPTLEDRLNAAGYRWQSAGENIAAGYATAALAMSGWMDSPGHRENILNTNFTELGTGYAIDATGQPYYVQLFGRPR